MKMILAIETSCDDTSVAIIKNGKTILSNVLSSQIKSHQAYGGVVPELASRLHAEKINYLIDKALNDAAVTFQDITACAVTVGPGLEGALLVGVSVAKVIASSLNIPLIPVNHIHGHIYAHLADHSLECPFLSLIVSGGHTQLIHVPQHDSFDIIGKTRDDAAGEVFDKVARALGLGYPGGPIIEKTAQTGDATRFKFTIPMKHDGLDFSFSGLKTAVIQLIKSLEQTDEPLPIADICASFQKVVADTLVIKTMRAFETISAQRLIVGGGVIANTYITTALADACKKRGIDYIPIPRQLCTDNAAMIGLAAYCLPTYYQNLQPIRVNSGLPL